MFKQSTYVARREGLKNKMENGLLVFMGNDYVGMNYKDNTYRFRQDSSFLYFLDVKRLT